MLNENNHRMIYVSKRHSGLTPETVINMLKDEISAYCGMSSEYVSLKDIMHHVCDTADKLNAIKLFDFADFFKYASFKFSSWGCGFKITNESEYWRFIILELLGAFTTTKVDDLPGYKEFLKNVKGEDV